MTGILLGIVIVLSIAAFLYWLIKLLLIDGEETNLMQGQITSTTHPHSQLSWDSEIESQEGKFAGPYNPGSCSGGISHIDNRGISNNGIIRFVHRRH